MSIIITTLAGRSYEGEPTVVGAVQAILKRMQSHVEKRGDKWWVPNPADLEENFADKWNEKPEKAQSFFNWLNQAQRDFEALIGARTLEEQEVKLSALRPGRSLSKGVTAFSSVVLQPSDRVPDLADDSHRHPLRLPVALRYKAKVTASVYQKQYGRKELWKHTDRPVNKGVWLRFAVETNTPSPYDVQWQVVNTGTEAREKGGLRGDFYPSEPKSSAVRWEMTSYTGTHWVQAFVIKNGTCVAESEKRFVRVRNS